MIAFFIFYLLIYGLLQTYAYLRLRPAFGPGWSAPLIVFLVLMTIGPILFHALEKAGFLLLPTILAYASYLWMGLLLLFVSCSLAIDLYRLVLVLVTLASGTNLANFSLTPFHRAIGPLLLSILILTYGFFEAANIRLRQITIPTEKLPAGVMEIRIAQISDLHLGLLMRARTLRKVAALVNRARADIIVSTGDLVDGEMCNVDELVEISKKMKSRYGKFAVTGNHEFYAGLEKSLAFTRASGFTVLRGEQVEVGGLILAGVDDNARDYPSAALMRAPESKVLSGLPKDRFILLLKHQPRLDTASQGLFDLQLSGHTHGGQIFPFSFLTWLSNKYNAGLYDLSKGGQLYVSRGTGTWGPPARFLSPPEVTLIRLVRLDQESGRPQ